MRAIITHKLDLFKATISQKVDLFKAVITYGSITGFDYDLDYDLPQEPNVNFDYNLDFWITE